jgi:hypothetical protein
MFSICKFISSKSLPSAISAVATTARQLNEVGVHPVANAALTAVVAIGVAPAAACGTALDVVEGAAKVGRLANQAYNDYMTVAKPQPVANLIDFSEEPIVKLDTAITIIEEYDPSVVPAAN